MLAASLFKSSQVMRMIAVPHHAYVVLQHASMSTDSHDDFKPQPSSSAPTSVIDQIKKDITDNEVLLYMKGHPSQPMCGFSARVVALLNAYDVKFASRNVLDDNELREGIKEYSNWPTIPQLYIKGEFVGGCDILWQAHEEGQFKSLLNEA